MISGTCEPLNHWKECWAVPSYPRHTHFSENHSDSSNPTTSTAKSPVFPGKTSVQRRLWRLTGRLTRVQGSALDDAACASMHVHGRAGKPKQLARNAINPGKTRVLQRRGQEPNNPRNPWENRSLKTRRRKIRRALQNTPCAACCMRALRLSLGH